MKLFIEDRPSDSPFVERVWHSQSERVETFISVAACRLDLVVWKQDGQTHISLRGPETQASHAPVPEDAEFFGVLFKPGVLLPHLPITRLVNGEIVMPKAGDDSFWLNGAAWQIPTYENADTFVDRLMRDGLLAQETLVHDVLRGHQPDLSVRSVQRRFLSATGLTHTAIHQIERARRAVSLLQRGVSILDTVYEMGYFDQPHLTRSFKHYIGQTPAQIADKNNPVQLSFLYDYPE